jgi:hypothetical protein
MGGCRGLMYLMASEHSSSILPGFDKLDAFLHSEQIVRRHYTVKQLMTPFIIAIVLFFIFAPQQSINNFELLIFLSPLWVPFMLYKAVHDRFQQMTRAKFFSEQEFTLLELRIPRDTTKTPFAMETFFSNMHIGSGETTWYKRYFQGGTRPWWSLEIVSDGGQIHFYIWTRTGYRRLVESFLYAQYPDIEIIEAEDYSRLIDPSEHGYGMFAIEYSLSKGPAYPIKTYVDYNMEPGDKPEETVDPLAQVIETMASLRPGEQFWMQIIFRMTKLERYEGRKRPDGKQYTWLDETKEAIDDLRKQTVRIIKRVDPVTGAVSETETFPNPTKGQSEGIAAIERKANKQVFDVGIRTIYLGTDQAFQGIMIPYQLNMFKPFNNQAGNALGVFGVWSGIFNDWPGEDPGGHHKHHLHQEVIQMYRRRAYFYDPYKGPWMILSTEELATLFHIPSAAVTTPNLPRIQSATRSAPSNLPQ